jgi:hypothetical protein
MMMPTISARSLKATLVFDPEEVAGLLGPGLLRVPPLGREQGRVSAGGLPVDLFDQPICPVS